jgi:O-antigen/teichoic acid export membrane protein
LKKQLQQLSIYGIGQLFNLVTPLLVVPYLVLHCGVANYGKISIGMAIAFFLMVFIDYGTDISAVKEMAVHRDHPEKRNAIFATTLGTKAVLFMVTTLIFMGVVVLFPFFNQERALFFLGIPILLGQLLNPTWLLQGLEDFTRITLMTIASKLVYLLLIFGCIQSPSDYIYVNLFWGIANIMAYGIILIYCVKKYHFSWEDFQKNNIKTLLKNNFSLFTSQIFVSLQMYSPVVLLGYFGSSFLAGQFRIVEQIIVIFKTYILLFFNFVYPRVCYLIETNTREAMRYWKSFNGMNFCFIAGSMAFLYLFSEWAVSFFTKSSIYKTADLLQWGIWVPLLMALSIPLKQLLLGYGMQRVYTRTTMILVVFSTLLIAISIPFFQIRGVFWVLIATEMMTIVLFSWYLKDRLQMK